MIMRPVQVAAIVCVGTAALLSFSAIEKWESKFVKQNKDGSLQYQPDEKGNTIPDFSGVGYYGGDRSIPDVAVVKVVESSVADNQGDVIQAAINEVARRKPDANGFRGAILLKKGTYKIPAPLRITESGIVLRGEGDTENGTRLIATTSKQEPLLAVSGSGNIREIPGSRTAIKDEYVPAGTHSFTVANSNLFKKGDRIIVYQPTNDAWISDLKMNQIEARNGTKQWTAKEYHFQFERVITSIKGNTVFIDNPIVMPIETKYGGGEIYKYDFSGRITQVGIEHIYFESTYEKDTSENHAWDAIAFNKIENGWIRNVTARYFAYSCANLGSQAKNISVLHSRCFDHKSVITGGRRYSFANNGQLNLFMDCHTADGRHDFVTGARTCGPNVFVRCTAKSTHADIGPHHRWSMGTLYDNIFTDGEINIQDRGNWGSGHGWAGVTQVVWNCTVKRAAIQNPWVSGKNYCIGMQGDKYDGRLKGKPDAEWEGQNKKDLQPASLYEAQLKARQAKK
jgi:hypothetical protein